MIRIRKGNQRGYADHGWLESRHTFSFAQYHDPEHVGFSVLRVINEDRVAPGAGFPTHGHRDMEIVSYILEGALEHKDNMGNGSIIRPGDVQRMSAGTGVTHSEYNASDSQPVRFLQIWIFPDQRGIQPGYEQKQFGADLAQGKLCLVASPDGRNGSVLIHQDISIYVARLNPNESVTHPLRISRRGWIQVTRGEVAVNNEELAAGDGAAVENEESVKISATDDAEILLFDLS
ncbi:MAG: pirin family protein [Gammaproteobacteria bacterium]|jgi:redox-sensitive bicupin YhaK (pirin superfamily)